MATGERTDPYRGFNFRVEFDGMTSVSFSECSGLTADRDAVDYREGNDVDNSVRKLPGLSKYTNITLKRGYTQNNEGWKFYQQILTGTDRRVNGFIILMDEQRKDVLRWRIKNAFINKIEGPAFKAAGNEVAIESMELVHEGIMLDFG